MMKKIYNIRIIWSSLTQISDENYIDDFISLLWYLWKPKKSSRKTWNWLIFNSSSLLEFFKSNVSNRNIDIFPLKYFFVSSNPKKKMLCRNNFTSNYLLSFSSRIFTDLAFFFSNILQLIRYWRVRKIFSKFFFLHLLPIWIFQFVRFFSSKFTNHIGKFFFVFLWVFFGHSIFLVRILEIIK